MINVSSQERNDNFLAAMAKAAKCKNKIERYVMEEIAQHESALWFDVESYDEKRESLAQTVKDGASIADIKAAATVLEKLGFAIEYDIRCMDILKNILNQEDI